MKKLTSTMCLTLAILLVSLVTGCGADYDKGLAAYESGDFATALREWTPLAEQGNISAQRGLGSMYYNGKGVSPNYKTAAKWYTRAAEQGDASSQTTLGVLYAKGLGVIKDNVYAHMWGHIAAANGDKIGDKLRDDIATRMTSADISASQKLASECIRKKYKGC